MKTIALALIIGFASVGAAHAEWEILDRGSAVAAPPPAQAQVQTKTAPTVVASTRSGAGTGTLQTGTAQK